MKRTPWVSRVSHLVYLLALVIVFVAMFAAGGPSPAHARVRDSVEMGDPTDDQSPTPGPSSGKTERSATGHLILEREKIETSSPRRLEQYEFGQWSGYLILIFGNRVLILDFHRITLSR